MSANPITDSYAGTADDYVQQKIVPASVCARFERKSEERRKALMKALPTLELHCGEVFLESIRKAMEGDL